MPRKKTVAQLLREAKKVFNRYIRRRDTQPNGYGRCCSCGTQYHFDRLQAGHYIHNKASVRFDPRNVHAQCVDCNKFRSGNGPAYAAFLVQRYGPQIITKLHEKSKEIHRWSRSELEELLATYKAKLDELE